MKIARISGPRNAAPLSPLDPRIAPWREDLADIALADLVAVPHYVSPVEMVAVRQIPLLTADRPDAPAASELLPGETFRLLDTGHGFGWGACGHDGYVGHVALDALAPAGPFEDGATESLIGPGDALLFCAADIKAEIAATLPMGARMRWRDHDERFVCIASGPHAGQFLHRRHLITAGDPRVADWVAIAEQFVGAPYRWGGRSRSGVDCSGLIQMARMLAGHPCRRDSDMQASDAAAQVPDGSARRGDIAFWPGHIGVMLDSDRLLHANAHWMACVAEPLGAVEARAEAGGGPARARLMRF